MPIESRPFRTPADLAAILALVSLEHQQAVAPGALHPGDVVWRLFQNTLFDPARDVRLWEDAAGTLLGFAWHEAPDGIVFQVHPQLRGVGSIEAEIAAWGAGLVDRAAPAYDGHLWAHAADDDAATLAALARLGFVRDEWFAHNMIADLGQPVADAPLPEGWVLRQVGAEAEWAARVELHRDVWHPSRVTLAAYRRLRAAPLYRPDLDLVAVAPNGTLAAYAICWLDPASRTGEFEPVGTRAAFRGQGIGRAVVRAGLRRLRALGARAAYVTAVGSNLAARRLYESAGFRTGAVERLYGMRLASAAGPATDSG